MRIAMVNHEKVIDTNVLRTGRMDWSHILYADKSQRFQEPCCFGEFYLRSELKYKTVNKS